MKLSEPEIDSLKVRVGYNGKPQQFKYGFDLALREMQRLSKCNGCGRCIQQAEKINGEAQDKV